MHDSVLAPAATPRDVAVVRQVFLKFSRGQLRQVLWDLAQIHSIGDRLMEVGAEKPEHALFGAQNHPARAVAARHGVEFLGDFAGEPPFAFRIVSVAMIVVAMC